MEILKESTRSLCNICYQEIKAKIYVENGQVIMEKECPEHGKFYSLIEKDCDLYRLLSRNVVCGCNSIDKLMLYISSRCNINCQFCYEHSLDKAPEPSLCEIEDLLKNYKKKIIVLCGREPTCREDLSEIIKLSNKKNTSGLLTNGIKLSNEYYLLQLKKAGLKWVGFSLNGFNDEIYKRMNGQPLLDLKLRALENLKKFRIKTIISMTLARGINDDQIKKVYDYCLANRSFVTELRIRTISPIGRYLDIQPYYMSELIDLITISIGVDKSAILRENYFMEKFFNTFYNIFSFNILSPKLYLSSRLCSIHFNVKGTKKVQPIGNRIKSEWTRKSLFRKFLLPYYLIRAYGIHYCIVGFFELFRLDILLREKRLLRIRLRCWPNLYTIDLEENKKCTSDYYKNKITLPFCYYNIIDSKQEIVG